MITIRQHGDYRTLHDLKDFILDLEPWQRRVSHWTIQIAECSGPNCLALSELTSRQSQQISPRAFEDLCQSINQTIDGEFVAYIGTKEVLRLPAVDSTYWEISGPPEFEERMLSRYGAYGVKPRMVSVEVTGWKVGFDELTCRKVIRDASGLGLVNAKKLTDGLLDGVSQRLSVPSWEDARRLVNALSETGAIAHVVTEIERDQP
ncbi:MAG: hypothetical protein IPK97_19225 [Ahniella sp.]|nr:hypothetical protein [Ahniella sp.]